MGGSKKKSPAKQEKSQTDAGKKSTKKGRKEESSGSKAEITVMLTDDQAMKAIKNAKVITIQELARQTGVKISAANAYLKKSVKNGTVKKIGGYSGHHIYQPVSA